MRHGPENVWQDDGATAGDEIPERRLVAAVMLEAITALRGKNTPRAWFLGGTVLTPFDWACWVLGYDPEVMRERFRREKRWPKAAA